MRPPRFAESPPERVVAGLDEYQRGGILATQPAVNFRQALQLLAFTRVDQQNGAFEIASTFHVQLGERRNKRNRKIIDTVEAQILERAKNRAFARAGKAREDD